MEPFSFNLIVRAVWNVSLFVASTMHHIFVVIILNILRLFLNLAKNLNNLLEENQPTRESLELTLTNEESINIQFLEYFRELEITRQWSDTLTNVSPTDLSCSFEEEETTLVSGNCIVVQSSYCFQQLEIKDVRSDTTNVSTTDLACSSEEEKMTLVSKDCIKIQSSNCFQQLEIASLRSDMPVDVSDTSFLESKPEADPVTWTRFQNEFYVPKSRGIKKQFNMKILDDEIGQGDIPRNSISLNEESKSVAAIVEATKSKIDIAVTRKMEKVV